MDDQIKLLQREVAILKARTEYLIATILVIVVVAVLGFTGQGPSENDVLKVRQITIVDEKGVERIYIGSPVPDPMVGGKRVPRRMASSGIIMNNDKGMEVGGWGVLADGTQQLILDDSRGQERVALFQPATGKQGGMILKDENGFFRMFVGVINSSDPRFALRDNKGRLRFDAVVDSAGMPLLSFYDETGNVTRSIGP